MQLNLKRLRAHRAHCSAALMGLVAGAAMAQAPQAPLGNVPSTAAPTSTAPTRNAAGALVLSSGVEVLIVKPGVAPLSYPTAADSVRVHYEGTFEDGRVFDSSYERGQAASFPLSRVIPCWTQGLQQIPVGATARLKCPAATAYGERGAGGGKIPPNTPLLFKVELLGVLGR